MYVWIEHTILVEQFFWLNNIKLIVFWAKNKEKIGVSLRVLKIKQLIAKNII